MRILFDQQIFSYQRFGGISRYFAELVKAMGLYEGISAKLLSPLCTNYYAKDVPANCRIGVPFPSIAKTEKFVRFVNNKISPPLIDRYRPNILHQTYYPKSGTYRRSGVHIVTTVYDMIHELFPRELEDSEVISRLKLKAVSEADLVICISENTRNDLIAITGIERNKTAVIHLGADHFQTLRTPVSKLSDRPYLLYVGLRGTYKNFPRVLKAYAKHQDLLKRFNLVCFGGGQLNEFERGLMKKLSIPVGNVVMANGGDEVLTALYQNAVAFIYPSLYEGFGVPPLEAMMQGCPVISSNTSSLPEVLGDAVEYFNPYDTDELVKAIDRVVQSPERIKELMSRGHEHASRFTWQHCADQTLAAYRGLIRIS